MPGVDELNNAIKTKAKAALEKKIAGALEPIKTMLARQNITKYDSQIEAFENNIIDELLPSWTAKYIKIFLDNVDKYMEI